MSNVEKAPHMTRLKTIRYQKKASALSLFFFVCGRPPVIHVFDGIMVRVNNRDVEPKNHPRRQL